MWTVITLQAGKLLVCRLLGGGVGIQYTQQIAEQSGSNRIVSGL